MKAGSMLVASLLLAGGSAHAVELAEGRLSLNGFGGWTYGITKDNAYLAGTPGGSYAHAALGLNLGARVLQNLHVAGQFEVESDVYGLHLDFDYAFADYRPMEGFHLRFGRMKLPFGISTEVFDVGTLRPFYFLPQSFYGPVGLIGESLDGANITGNTSLGDWGLQYDLYFGGTTFETFAPSEQAALGLSLENTEEPDKEQTTRNLGGGRLWLETPADGLRVGVSGMAGEVEGLGLRFVVAAHSEYLTDVWSIRAEYALEGSPEERIDGGYLEVARKFGDHWQIALMGGGNVARFADMPNPAEPSLVRHLEGAVGLNYWFSPEAVLKAGFHRVEGNRLALPHLEDVEDTIADGELVTSTNLFQFGMQFSF